MTNTENKGAWDYAMPILGGMATAAVQGAYNNYTMRKQNEFNAQQAEIQRQFNAAEAEKARQYETEMSNTAYQRAYADMEKAGLNPHLAGGQGGASTPAGSMASGNAATSAGTMPIDMASTLNAALTSAQIENMKADTANKTLSNKWIEPTKKQEIANMEADEKIKKQQLNNLKQEFDTMDIQQQQMVMDYATAYETAKSTREKAKIEAEFYGTKFGKGVKKVGLTLSSLLPILGPIGRFGSK